MMINSKINTMMIAALLLTPALTIGGTTTYPQESAGQYIDSTAITAKVKAELLADKSIKSLPITVKTYKNTVQLSGFVETDFQKKRAVKIAKHVAGVNVVLDSLVVK